MKIALLAILFLSGCLSNVDGNAIPQDALYYPSVLLKSSQTLYVTNTNLDRQYQTGSITQIDLPTTKITNVSLVPSLTGQVIANQDFSLLLATSAANNTLSIPGGQSLMLHYNAPYFLQFFADQKSGLLGYLSPATNEVWDPSRFSIVANQPELQYFTYDPVVGLSITQSLQISSCFPPPTRPYRRIARIGGIFIIDNNVYVQAEFVIDDPVDPNKFTKRVFLIQTTNDLLKSGTLCNSETLKPLDITATEKAQAARGLVISGDQTKAYLLLSEDPMIVTVDLAAQKVIQRAPTCKGPDTIRLSPDATQGTLLVACSRSNELIAYNTSDLGLFGKYIAPDTTGGPLDILFDTASNQIFVSYQQDHKIGIFSYENSAANSRSLTFGQWLQLSR